MTQKNKDIFDQSEPPVDLLKKYTDQSGNVMIVSHVDPDGDSLGTLLATGEYFKSLGKKVSLFSDGELPDKYQHLKDIDKIKDPSKLTNDLNFDLVVALECPNSNRIGSAVKFIKEDTVIINIDHHQDNEIYGALNWLNQKASSVAEMMFEYFEKVDFVIEKHVADYLFTAIMTDTGRFRYRSTSERTMAIVSKLIKYGADPQYNCDMVYYNMKPSTIKLTGKVLNNIEFYHKGRLCLLSLTDKMLNDADASMVESDGLVDFTLFSKGVIIGVLLKEVDANTTKVSMRSKDSIDVASFAAKYGGGGHFNASGFTVNKNIDSTKIELIDEIKGLLDA